MIDGHGDDTWRFGGMVKHNFSTNIHAAFCHSPLLKILLESDSILTGYPEPEPFSVESRLSRLHGCRENEVMVTNGATEAIYLIAKEFSGGLTSIFAPTFREYQDACLMHGHNISFIQALDEISPDCELVWICNPNNPSGKVFDKTYLMDVITRNPDKIFIIDQAYSDYTSLPTLTAGDAVKAGNVILLGSLTKRFAVPGLRIGYAIGCRQLINRVKSWRMPWSVNAPAIKGASYLLDNIDRYNIDSRSLHEEALRIAREFSESGISVSESDCNFILCRLPRGKASDLKRFLIEEYGILIRDASNFEGLDSSYFRIAAQAPEENDLLINAVKRWLTI